MSNDRERQLAHSSVFYRNMRAPHTNFVRSKGMYLYDHTGKEFLDAAGGVAVNIIGHQVTEITQALIADVESTSFVYGAAYTNPWQERLAHNVASIAPFPEGKVFFCSGGSEANESAIKLARQYHLERGNLSKWKVISRWQSYHGSTLGTLSLSGRPSWRTPYDPYLVHSPKIIAPYCYRYHDVCDETCADFFANDLERTILMEGRDTVSAFIAEPVIGTALVGAVPPPGYYERIREICDAYDVLFIADEVLTGYGRTGTPFAIEMWDAEPDIITVGKGLGSGYAALGACIASPKVVEAFRDGTGQWVHSFTYSGLPLAMRVGVAVFDYVQEHRLFEASAKAGLRLNAALTGLAERCDAIGDVRGVGLLAGIELVQDRATKEPFDPQLNLTARIVSEAHRRGVIVREGSPDSNFGKGGDQIQITPPFIISDADIDLLINVLEESIRVTLAGA